MLAGFILVSAAVGFITMGATIALSLPAWITLATYPAVCSLTLMICAASVSIRSRAAAPRAQLHRQHIHG